MTLDLALELRFLVPMAALAHQLFLMAAAHGWGAQDDAAVVKVFEALSGVSASTKTEAETN